MFCSAQSRGAMLTWIICRSSDRLDPWGIYVPILGLLIFLTKRQNMYNGWTVHVFDCIAKTQFEYLNFAKYMFR